MKFSELWLHKWVNPAIDSNALANQITIAGLEVDSVEPVASSFHSMVIGEVVECAQHPNTDKLHVTKVNISSNHLLDIICSAPNCHQGLHVAVATIGAVLPGDFKIKAAKLHGKPSEGMLCSFSELGISDNHSSIIKLPADAPIGTNIHEYLKLDDNTIKISMTPNHANCLGIIGVARDIAMLNQLPLVQPEIIPVGATINNTLPITVKAPEACPRYLGHVVKGINIKAPTPLWMKEKLHHCRIHSINAVVDITNYVLLKLGQPMHTFNKDHIEGSIVVQMAKEGKTLVLLNSTEAKLNADTLVITNHNKALAMGSIFSGKHSGMNDKTQNMLLECTFFSPLSITSHAHHHGLHTNASHHYEHGIDPALQHKAMEHATHLLINIYSGEAGPVIDITNKATLPKHATITLHHSKLDHLISHHIADEQVTDILHHLSCKVTKGKDKWQAVAPSWHFNMEIEEDLVEEVAHVYSYNNIPDEPVQASLIMGTHHEADLSLKHMKTLLNNKGYQEVITYSFIDPKVQQMIHPGIEALLLPSPISVEMSAMHLSLWTGLLATMVYNQNHQQNHVHIFKSSLHFIPDTQAPLGIHQDLMLASVICSNHYKEHWNLAKETIDFYDLKGNLESILNLTSKLNEVEFHAEANPALHPGQSTAIYLKGEHIGFVGVVHPELEHKLDLNSHTLVFKLEWNKLTDHVVPQAREISRFPANHRDITVVVAENIPTADILSKCKKVGINQVVGVNLFDMYHSKGVAEGYKSLTISLILQDTSHTLKEEEIATTIAKCVEALKEQFQASLRD